MSIMAPGKHEAIGTYPVTHSAHSRKMQRREGKQKVHSGPSIWGMDPNSAVAKLAMLPWIVCKPSKSTCALDQREYDIDERQSQGGRERGSERGTGGGRDRRREEPREGGRGRHRVTLVMLVMVVRSRRMYVGTPNGPQL